MTKRIDAKLLIALVIVVVFWASAFVGIRIGLRSYSPGHLVLFRFAVASVILGGYACATRMKLPSWRDLPALALVGLTGITLYQLLLTYGEVTVTAGTASFLIATGPIFTALFAVLFGGERLRLVGWGAIGMSFAGGALIALGEGDGFRFSAG
ncbi:MAG: EamA family transporter, partial [Chloroflexi bacterium]|nr:EamA family transporter [Chloroflexota bacterium]